MPSPEKIKLLYFKGSEPNFGDDLNEWIWPSLLPGAFDVSSRSGLLGIGTIIGLPFDDLDRIHVFSSGTGYDSLAGCDLPYQYWCVRGPLTARTIGLDPEIALTDGAILISELHKPATGAQNSVGLIPHWESLHFGGWQRAAALASVDLIDPRRAPRAVIDDILKCKLVLTESLHGAIIADTYGIPWIPFASTANVSVFKWCDWAASLNLRASMQAVRPPHFEASRRFGRPRMSSGGLELSPEIGMSDYERKFGGGQPHHTRNSRVKALVKSVIEKSKTALGYRALESCATDIQRLLKAESYLSARNVRESRLDALLSMLRKFGTSHGLSP